MIEFEKPNIECVETDDKRNYAKFICEPLERGYGMTIGNSLRRILLSSLPGAAITSVKINGVVHEFSTVSGVVEDVPEIIVNLKNVRLRVHDEEEKITKDGLENSSANLFPKNTILMATQQNSHMQRLATQTGMPVQSSLLQVAQFLKQRQR